MRIDQRVACMCALVGLLLAVGADPAAAQARQGQLDRRDPAGVKGTAFSLLIPLYENTTVSDGGWRDDGASRSNRLGVVGSIVSPIGHSWGWRALLGGGWSKRKSGDDDVQNVLAFDDKVGDFVVGGEIFRRNPNTGAGGISYLYRGRTTDFFDSDRSNRLGIFGEIYTDVFDFGVNFGYAFGKADGVSTTINGQPLDLPNRDFDGFVLDVDARWYATDRLSAVLGLALEVQTDKFEGGGQTYANLESTTVGPVLKLEWLPPLGAKGWLMIEGSFIYQHASGSIAAGNYPVDPDRNQFKGGANARILLPSVASLKELFRQY